MALCQNNAPSIAGIKTIKYQPSRSANTDTHHYVRPAESHVLNGQAVAKVLMQLKQAGFIPDIIVTHTGWGEALYVKDVFPDSKLIGFFEFYYQAHGADTDFDPEFPQTFDDVLRIRTKNITHLLSLEAVNAGICPTQWQKNTHPKEFQYKLHLIHEGINTDLAVPNAEAVYQLPNGKTLSRKDEVITYVARNLEPYRGFHIMMRAIEQICKNRPKAQVLIVGGDDISYGRKLPVGETWRQKMLKEVTVDENRVHFLGRIPYQQFIKILQVSSAHIYLTVPFVLSWSMLEAMSAGCAVIGSNTAPVSEVIEHGKNGLLVDFFSIEAITEAVDFLLNNPKKAQELGLAARKTVLDRYTNALGVKQYEELFNSMA
jgi:glycosyltransferase involved in cell wall biosynthesis